MATKVSSNERIAVNTVFLAIRMVVVLFITLYTTRVLLAALGIEDYGIYSVVAGFVSMCSFISSAMAHGIQRFFNFESGKNGVKGGKKVFNAGIRIQVILTIIIVVFIELIGFWYINYKMVIPDERLVAAKWVFQAALLSLALTMLSVPFNASIMAHENMHYYALLGILDAVLKLAIAFIIKHFHGDQLILYAYLLASVSVVNLMLNSIYARARFEEIRFAKRIDKELLKSILVFSGWNAFGTFARSMRSQGVGMVLNLFFGPVVNAAQGVAGQVKGAFNALVANLNTAARPQIVQSYSRGETHRTITLMFSVSKLVLFLLFIFAYPILLELPTILGIWLGKNIPEHTVSFLRLVIVTMFVTDIHMVTSSVVHATGKMRTYQLVCSALNVTIIPLVYIVMKLGANAETAFWLGLLIEILVQIASLLILRKLIVFSIRSYCKEILWPFLKVVLISFTLPLIPYLIMKQGFIRLVVVTMISVLFSCFVVYNWGLNVKERELVLSFVNRIVKIKKKQNKN